MSGKNFQETFGEAWRLRYGSEPSLEIPEIGSLLGHRSVRAFAEKPVPEAIVEGLVAAAQSASTSSNLQTWSLISIQDPERRKAIDALTGNQRQVLTAPWFFAFVADLNRLGRVAEAEGEAGEGLDHVEFFITAVVDASLAAERMAVAAEALGLGVCYIGMLRNHPEQVAELLRLPEGVFGVFGFCLGYPDPAADAQIKPRLGQAQVWFREEYPHEIDVSEYDTRMAAFYESQRMGGEKTWSSRSATRTRIAYMSGREKLADYLRAHGIAKK